ncbi:MAG: ATPase P, partial [Candidatus Zixiibacteriota bacterium]
MHAADLEEYYAPGEGVGLRPQASSDRFAILDDPEIQRRLLDFTDGRTARVTFSLPEIHCSSCVWLLEHLPQLQEGIISCRVNFAKREAALKFVPETISLRRTAELLASLGYAPAIRLAHVDGRKADSPDRSLYARLAVAH